MIAEATQEQNLDEMVQRLLQVETADLADLRIEDAGNRVVLEFSFLGFVGGEGHELHVAFSGVEEFRYHHDVRASDESVFPILVDSVSVNRERRAAGERVRFHLDGEMELELLCREMQATQDGVTTTLRAAASERVAVPA